MSGVGQFLRGSAVAIGVLVVAALAFFIGLLWGASPERETQDGQGVVEVDGDGSAEPTETATGSDAETDSDLELAEVEEVGDAEASVPDSVVAESTTTVIEAAPVDGAADSGASGDAFSEGDASEDSASEDEVAEDDEDEDGDGGDEDGGDDEVESDEASGGSAYFTASTPEGWEVTRLDQELSYGWRTEYRNADGATIRVEVSNSQPPASAAESAQAISAAVADRLVAGPDLVQIGDFDGGVFRIAFRGQAGDNRSDYFLVDGDRGYAVLAVSDGPIEPVDVVARTLIATIRTTG